LLDIKRYYW